MRDIDTLADTIFASVKAYCSQEIEKRVLEALTEMRTMVAAIPEGKPGKDGKEGVNGKDGKDGEDGQDGDPGEDGAPGNEGPPGKDGKDGEHGTDGKNGERGEKGIDGKDGALGKDGQDGKDGEDGKPGERGERGDPGERGDKGDPGFDGKDGAPGRDGERGEKGDAGIDGKDGAPGADGQKGIDGRDGTDGLPGVSGQEGRDGRDGKDGAPGRDALQLEILETIDEARTYARGTYAKHDGGLIRAYRQTDAITEGIEKAGWQVIVAGFKEVTFAVVDERGMTLCLQLTDGKTYECELRPPVMLYRGIWTEGEYERGDTTTRDGSLWHCERKTTARPGDSPDWKLATKRGRDGKEGKQGERGERGPDGKPGRDFTRLSTGG